MEEANKQQVRVRIEAPARETAGKTDKTKGSLSPFYYLLLVLSYVFSFASLYLSFVSVS